MKRIKQAACTLSFLAVTACGGMEGQEFLDEEPKVGQVAQLLRSSKPVPGEYIVVLKNELKEVAQLGSESIAQEVALKHGGQVLHSYKAALKGFTLRLSEAQVQKLLQDPRVAYVQENGYVQVGATQTGATWGIDRIDQTSLPLNQTYTYNNDASGVHAYIVDTGVRLTHSQFTGRMGNGFDAITTGGTGADCHGHGTHVAGTVGGTTWGVAKGVTIHPVRVLDCSGYGTDAQVIAGIEWVVQNHVKPAVANMSLGGDASQPLDDAVTAAVNAGIVFAVAAGNDSTNACNYSPARAPAAITVGSTTSSDARSSFSNYGTCLDIFAPGSSITSASNSSNTGSTSMSGTSMASPHVAGAAALYLGANPTATPQQVRDALVSNGTQNKVTSPGTGSPNVLLYTSFIGGGTPPPVDTTAPSTSITSPAGGATLGGTATISASASDNVGVTKVEFYSGTTLLGSDTSSPYSFDWNTATVANGTYSLTTKAFDAAGNTATSAPVSVSVNNTTGSCSTATQLLINPGFEGTSGWTTSSGVINATTSGSAPYAGTSKAWLNGYGSARTDYAYQQISIPATACSASLTFFVKITTSETTTATAYDKLAIQVRDSANTVKATLATYSNLDKSTAYAQKTFDLSAYKGQTIRIYFNGTEDASAATSFFLDEAGVNITQ
ncbi:S8 family serine peptidase [Hyalangium minutum]|uniref:Alkaline serine exoprotease A n=1 Tax=Hyalangium minutum TaxID=394096 RepID=A0A085WXD1_9BACT|nr:S8 family serine peptidase [Hyalangium minutum]KFE72344.1 Alkaline serine exoprotease A precursor [Hyalangium minutum]